MTKEQLEEDIRQYNEALETFSELEPEYIELAYDLSKRCLMLADRWNQIMLNSAKLCTLKDVTKTSFEKWAYGNYRIMSKIHEFARVTWRQGKEEYSNSFQKEM